MSFKNRVYNLMKAWCDELLKTQLDMPDPLLNGAILCPGCALVHGNAESADRSSPGGQLHFRIGCQSSCQICLC